MSRRDPFDPPTPRHDEERFTTYETNRVPWYIHAMWIIFAVAGVIYLLRYALSDFMLWW